MKDDLKFPERFLWGAASASYQVEGGITNCDWAQSAREGKVPSITDTGIDHYNRFEEDFLLAKELGHSCHRISIEWSRIEPEEGKFDMTEIEHYKKVLQSLHKNNLVPFVTLWHFTLPEWFVQKGGFTKKNNVKYFTKYCEFVVEHLKDLCKDFATMNEPLVYSSLGFIEGQWPPFEMKNVVTFYRVLRNLIKAHNETYIALKKKYKNSVEISVVKNNMYIHVSKKARWNIFYHIACKTSHWFWNEYFLNRVYKNLDVLDINYYFHTEYGPKSEYKKSDMGWDLYPEGLYFVLKHASKYGKPLRVTEAGIADEKDEYRTEYIKGLVKSVHRAIEDGAPVTAFMYWSLLDNYEWAYGFEKKFGLIAVDLKTKKRTPRHSAYEYQKICESNSLKKE